MRLPPSRRRTSSRILSEKVALLPRFCARRNCITSLFPRAAPQSLCTETKKTASFLPNITHGSWKLLPRLLHANVWNAACIEDDRRGLLVLDATALRKTRAVSGGSESDFQ